MGGYVRSDLEFDATGSEWTVRGPDGRGLCDLHHPQALCGHAGQGRFPRYRLRHHRLRPWRQQRRRQCHQPRRPHRRGLQDRGRTASSSSPRAPSPMCIRTSPTCRSLAVRSRPRATVCAAASDCGRAGIGSMIDEGGHGCDRQRLARVPGRQQSDDGRLRYSRFHHFKVSEVSTFGEVGGGLTIVGTDGWSGFVRGKYQFASDLSAGTMQRRAALRLVAGQHTARASARGGLPEGDHRAVAKAAAARRATALINSRAWLTAKPLLSRQSPPGAPRTSERTLPVGLL
jgi:hypothetical protein